MKTILMVCLVIAGSDVLATRLVAQEATIRFNRDIRPILSDKCLACHGPDERQRQADLRLDVDSEAKASAIVPGDVSASELIARITSDDDELRMPPPESGKSVSAEELKLLSRWIAQGAPYESHWSLIPPQAIEPPEVSNPRFVRNAIDRFVVSRLEQAGLSPAPPASKAALIRRASLDLTGLPPTPAEVDAFESDQSDAAWERVLDRLLASQRYGEHMARAWLDAARYADTNGYQYDLEREQWVWRDWVIHAFNSNMPYDEFTVQQIAGDLLPDATEHQKLATAFHRNHPITIEGGVIDEEYRTEYVVDRVVTTSTVWMGLTMTCARCHDHKYDPISQREFYQLFAFFNQVPERGLNGFAPKLTISSPLRNEELQRVEEQLAESGTRLKTMSQQLEGSLDQRLAALRQALKTQWEVVVPQEYRSEGGATLTVQSDQSILASGNNPAVELYELQLQCDAPIYALQLEALTDKSFVGGGTGRGSNGNFVLSELEAAVRHAADSEFQPIRIARAEADYSQQNYGIQLAIDGRIDRTGWAVDGNTKRENRVAWFYFEKPVDPEQVEALRVRLVHRWGGSHHIGRFRIAVTHQPVVMLPEQIKGLLTRDAGTLSDEERTLLEAFVIERDGTEAQRQQVARWRQLRGRLEQLRRIPATMVMADRPEPRPTHVLARGEYDKPGDEVSAGTPSLLPPMAAGLPRNRLGLARWLVSRDHPLTARVAVNRLWQQLLGEGLVRTVSDFGSQGEYPSHPDLLDYLAVEFMESGWNVKALQKRIMMSATYRQSSVVSEETRHRDPANRLMSRSQQTRLDAEVIRDSVLHASGLLVEKLGGPSVFPYHPQGLWQEINNRPGYSRTYQQGSGDQLYRRSLYTFWKRTVPPPSMAVFDAPEREFCVVRRSRTNTPLQALVMLNDPQSVEAARHLGQRMMMHSSGPASERLRYGFRLVMSRQPSAEEQRILASLFEDRLVRYRSDVDAARQLLTVGESSPPQSVDPAELAAWAAVGRALLNLSEFVTRP